MRIVHAFPPNYLAIRRALGRPPEHAIYCWEDVVYNPSRTFVSDALLAHESVHSAQQAKIGVERWWSIYLAVSDFRFGQELPAHVAEWLATSEAERESALVPIADRLASKMYGSLCSKMEARRLIRGALPGWQARQRAAMPGGISRSRGDLNTRSMEPKRSYSQRIASAKARLSSSC